MKNKKHNQKGRREKRVAMVATILLIVITFVAIFIVWELVIPMIEQADAPQFRAYKMECWEENSENIFVEIGSFCSYIAEDSKSYEIDNYKKIYDSCRRNFYDLVLEAEYLKIIEDYPYEFIIETEEVCEEVGVVEELIGVCEEAPPCNRSICIYSQVCPCSSIKDLKISWLEENCECQTKQGFWFDEENFEGKRFCKSEYKGKIDLYNEKGKEYYCKKLCQKYQCGDYFVEVTQ